MINWWLLGGSEDGRASLASFEGWSATVGGILEACGYEGFLKNQISQYEDTDPATEEWRTFILTWAAYWRTARVADEMSMDAINIFCEHNGLLKSAREGMKNPQTRLGRLFIRKIGQVYSGWILTIGKRGKNSSASRKKIEFIGGPGSMEFPEVELKDYDGNEVGRARGMVRGERETE